MKSPINLDQLKNISQGACASPRCTLDEIIRELILHIQLLQDKIKVLEANQKEKWTERPRMDWDDDGS